MTEGYPTSFDCVTLVLGCPKHYRLCILDSDRKILQKLLVKRNILGIEQTAEKEEEVQSSKF